MILASEAAQQTMELLFKHKTDELQKIDDGIKEQIKLGKFEYRYDGYISDEAKKELERCGYNVEVGSMYNDFWVNISWRYK